MKCRKFTGEWEELKQICNECGSESIKKGYAYLRTAKWQSGDKFICDVFGDGTAFFCGIRGRTHIRIISLALKKSVQRQGVGTRIMSYEAQKARRMGINLFTLRTSRTEAGQKFWHSLGARITGRNEEDWEMELRI